MKKLSVLALATLMITGCTTAVPTQTTEETDTLPKPEVTLPIEANYELNTAESSISWSASRLVATPHVGTIPAISGTLSRENDTFTQGQFAFDMTAITEAKNNQDFLTHIKGDDFFAVNTFPTSTINLTKIEQQTENEYAVTGDLTIKDQTNQINFIAIINDTGNNLRATADFDIDRTKWGITFESGTFFQQLGDRAIKDEITYSLDLLFEQK